MECIFCKIVAGSLPSKKIYEDERILAFYDIVPLAAVHALIIPKKHIPSLNDVGKDDWSTIGDIQRVAQVIARDLGIAESGFRLVNNCGVEGGQVVYHLHYHLLGGEQLAPIERNRM